tara:strand:+ start:2814 stop:2960 length:147 start_codon:yes stop_codon:yes gene_type:complete
MTVESKLDITGKAVTGIVQGSIFPMMIFSILAFLFSILFSLFFKIMRV